MKKLSKEDRSTSTKLLPKKCSFIEDEAGVSMDASCSADEIDDDDNNHSQTAYDNSFVDDIASTQHHSDEYVQIIHLKRFIS